MLGGMFDALFQLISFVLSTQISSGADQFTETHSC